MKNMHSNYKVLIIDDDAEVRRSLVHLFERAKWQVSELSNALNGVKKIISINTVLLKNINNPVVLFILLISILLIYTIYKLS